MQILTDPWAVAAFALLLVTIGAVIGSIATNAFGTLRRDHDDFMLCQDTRTIDMFDEVASSREYVDPGAGNYVEPGEISVEQLDRSI